MRQVTSTRGRPIAARRQHLDAGDPRRCRCPRSGGSPSARALGRSPRRRCCSVALPQRSSTIARGHLAVDLEIAADRFVCRKLPDDPWRSESAIVRGSTVNRLRPVGSTSPRPQLRRAGRSRRHALAVQGRRSAQRVRRKRHRPAIADRHRLPWGARPKTCSPSLMARSFRSHSQASMLRSASSGLISPRGRHRARGRCAAPFRRSGAQVVRAAADRARQRWRTRRRAARGPRCTCSSVGTIGGGRCPIVTAAMRRLACAASPGSLTMKG